MRHITDAAAICVAMFLTQAVTGCDKLQSGGATHHVVAPVIEQPYWVEELVTGLDLPRAIAWLPISETSKRSVAT